MRGQENFWITGGENRDRFCASILVHRITAYESIFSTQFRRWIVVHLLAHRVSMFAVRLPGTLATALIPITHLVTASNEHLS